MPLIGATTVTAVPSTATNIVSVITVFIVFPSLDTRLSVWFRGRALFFRWWLVTKAFALVAIALELRFQSLAVVSRFAVQLITRMAMTGRRTRWSGFGGYFSGRLGRCLGGRLGRCLGRCLGG